MNAAPPLVTVVVTTRNEERHIADCLRSVRNQRYPAERIELVVVDNASTDRTVALAREFTPHVYQQGPERSAQRNYGIIEHGSGEYALYLDADMILAPAVVARAVERMEACRECTGLYIPEIVLGQGALARVRRFERSFYDGTVIDAARFFRREVFAAIGGFDLAMTGTEDWDLDKELRRRGKVELLCRYDFRAVERLVERHGPQELAGGPAAEEFTLPVLFHDEAGQSLRRYFAKKAYYAGRMDRYLEKWGRDDPDLRQQLGPGYRFLGVFLEEGRWRRLIAHPGRAIGMYGLRLGVGGLFLLRGLLSAARR